MISTPSAAQGSIAAFSPTVDPETADRILIATITFRETGGELLLDCEFRNRDRVGPFSVGDIDTVKDACHKAGTYLVTFANRVDEARQDGPYQLGAAFEGLNSDGLQLVWPLVGQSAKDFRLLQEGFRRSWPRWRRPTAKAIPIVQLVADGPAAAFPLELLPVFDAREIPPLENASVVEEVASRFLGFTAVVARVGARTSRSREYLHNDPLRVQFVRYFERRRPWWLRWWPPFRRLAAAGFQREEDFLASLLSRRLVSIDGPWPATLPTASGVDRFLDALFDPTRALLSGFRDGPADLTHIACYCETEERNGDDYELRLSWQAGVKLREIVAGYLRRAGTVEVLPAARAPVILNACGTSTVDPLSAQSFQSLFLRNEHRAFVGTLAAIDDADAADYAERFYRFLLGGFTLGEAVLLARRQLLSDTGSPMGLLYVQYGNDQFVVETKHTGELPRTLTA